MPIPDYQTVMLPFLKTLSDGGVHYIRDIVRLLASEFKLTDKELEERIPSGQSMLFDNRVGWARTYLKKAGLVELASRGYYRITSRGEEVLKSRPAKIDGALLRQFPEFREFQGGRTDSNSSVSGTLGAIGNTDPARDPRSCLSPIEARTRRRIASGAS